MTDQKKTRRQVLEEFVAKAPNDAFSRYGLAMECMSSGDPAAAIHQFHLLVEQHADYIPAYLMYGQLLAREARTDEAKQVLSRGITAARATGDQHAQSEMEVLLGELR
jgi:predicted Zn-dependent protease